MLEKLAELKQLFSAELTEAKSKQQLSVLRDRYLGRKGGRLTLLMKGLRAVAASDRKEIGRSLNQFKASVEKALKDADELLAARSFEGELAKDSIDVTLPGKRRALGHLHPLTQVRREIEEIFYSLGYSVEDGPEIETTYYNFEALNIPESHPARDQGDTFYFSDSLLLRTHTSPVQIRTMEKHPPPSASSVRVLSIAETTPMPPIPRFFSKSRDWPSMSRLHFGISKERWNISLRHSSVKKPGFDSAPAILVLPSRVPRWIFPVLFARARVAASARKAVGSRF